MTEELIQKGVKITLSVWEEITGKFIGIEDKENIKTVNIRTPSGPRRVQFPRRARETESLSNMFQNIVEGQRIGIIFTDIPNEPVKVRIIDESRDDKKPSSHLKNGGRP